MVKQIAASVERWIARGEVKPLREHARPVQDAIIERYALADAPRWPALDSFDGYIADGRLDRHRLIAEQRERYLERFGEIPFGFVLLIRNELEQAIVTENPDLAASGTSWAELLAAHEANPEPGRGMPKWSQELWPVFLDTWGSEVLDDGWHRLCDYALRGIELVPAVFEPQG